MNEIPVIESSYQPKIIRQLADGDSIRPLKKTNYILMKFEQFLK